jgi:hypothetical protein
MSLEKYIFFGIIGVFILLGFFGLQTIILNNKYVGKVVNTPDGPGTIIDYDYKIFIPSRVEVRLHGDGDNRQRTFVVSEIDELK